MSATLPDRTAYRLTSDDEHRISTAMAELARSGATALEQLERVGMHSIGCTAHDLRDVELDWIHDRAIELVGPVPSLDCPRCHRTRYWCAYASCTD